MQKKIQDLVEVFRDKIEPHWTSDLLYEKFVQIPGAPLSAGFCGPSSVLLWKELTHTFPKETFSIAVGRVYCDSSEWIRGKHVWVVWHHGLKTSTIVDITADQSGNIEDKVIVENIDDLARRGINYISYQISRSIEEVDESPKQRAALLESKIGINQ